MDTEGIGRRIAYWRKRRGLNQSDFAALMGQSPRWVQSLEGGQRQSDPRLSVLETAARVLQIPIEVLLRDVPGSRCVDAVELAKIRDTLQRHDVITGTADTDPGEPLAAGVLWGRLVHARSAFQAGRYALLGTAVPELLLDANRAAARHSGEEQLAAFGVLAMALNLAESAAIKFGAPDLAVMSANRAVVAAERSEDSVIMASAACHLADAMTHDGRALAATAFAVAAAGRLEPDLLVRGADGLSVLGMLYLKAAMAQANTAEAAEDSRPSSGVADYLDQADEHADRLGRDDNRLWTAFGPTNVALYRVAADVQLSEGARAVAVAEAIPAARRAALPRERRAHHLADLARAYQQAGKRDKAVDTLLDAEREAPEEVRCRPRTRELVKDLRLLGVGAAEGRLRSLAVRCGLPE